MGIPGIYKELGGGERTALAKLAVQHIEQTGQPLRIAVDISIWQFQIQSSRGGRNPAVRTLYYRLLKLLSLSIQPLFVFDGPYRPSFKRGVKRAQFTASVDNFLTKILIKAFGFPYHDAPGEAEAECALLQKTGVVDAVLSEDVDTIMFGSTVSLRNWSSEGSRGNKSPTHVDVYKSERTKEVSGLDSQGMILVALMSGGDYIPAGIPHCGIKTACQAARGGFGQKLVAIAKDDHDALKEWRETLQHEIRTNESGFFQQRKKTFVVPDSFPDQKVLSYYTHPKVSSEQRLGELSKSIKWTDEIDVPKLRKFVEEAFNWTYLCGAKHFIRSLAPALLVRKMVTRAFLPATDRETINTKTVAEMNLVKAILGRRQHWVTEGEPELRIAYVPNDVVRLDLQAEEDIQPEQDDDDTDIEQDAVESGAEATQRNRSPSKKPHTYDPNKMDKLWILETFVKLGAPLLVETWEEEMMDPKKFAARKARARKKLASSNVRANKGAMDIFVKVTKPGPTKSLKSSEGGQSHKQNPDLPVPPVVPILLDPQEKALEENRRLVGTKKAKLVAQATSSQVSKPMKVSKVPGEVNIKESSKILESVPSGVPPRTVTQMSKDEDYQQPFITPRSKRRQHKHMRSESSTSVEEVPKVEGILPATPGGHISAGPSPRKKRSSPQVAKQPCPTAQLQTLEATPKRKIGQGRIDKYLGGDASPNSSRRVNRKIDFIAVVTAPVVEDERHEASIDSLPSPSALLSPPPSQVAMAGANRGGTAQKSETQREPPRADEGQKGKQRKDFVMIRESLEGTWKSLDHWETDAVNDKEVYKEVSILDLTGT